MARSLHLGAPLCACMLLGSSIESASAQLTPDFLGAMNERPARTASGVRGSGSSVLPELAARPKAGAKMDLVVEEGNGIRRVDDMQRNEAGEAEELEGRRLEEVCASNCFGVTCDVWAAWSSCAELESAYSCDCRWARAACFAPHTFHAFVYKFVSSYQYW
mmetsp:Transcript_93635/g.267944  ORF Transcript_93635/g.267944 Transcript_93635/m.267944 type:complete len:161 (+) Transcript_93635:259-741(+)